MSTEAVTSAFMALVRTAAGSVPVKSGERRKTDSQAKEPDRPYVRVYFVRLHLRTGIPGRWRGYARLEFFGETGVDAWAVGTDILSALGLGGVVCAPPRPNPVDTYELYGALERGDDPGNGALTYATIGFHYYD